MYKVCADRIFALDNDLILTSGGVQEKRRIELFPYSHRRTGTSRWSLNQGFYIGVSNNHLGRSLHQYRLYPNPILENNGIMVSLYNIELQQHTHSHKEVYFLLHIHDGNMLLEQGVEIGELRAY